MAWMIGIDEAGYGPNLGPLAVAASAWWVDENKGEGRRRRADSNVALLSPATTKRATEICLYRRLSKIVSRAACEKKLAIADSKQLYKPGLGLRQLERSVLAGLRALGEPSALAPGATTSRWSSLMARHAPPLPFYADYDCDLPIDATADEIEKLSTRFDTACGSAGVQLVDLRVRLVYPCEFNDLTNHFGTKGAALSHVSIGLLRETIDHITTRASHVSGGSSTTRIICDKHGGRNRYAALLQHHFPDEWIDTLAESGPASRYGWGSSNARTEVCFRVKGESELPVALASMTAKYHRELAMRAFNAFWCERLPNLRPTAGYPTDAKRFHSEIRDLQRQLKIDDDLLWRWR